MNIKLVKIIWRKFIAFIKTRMVEKAIDALREAWR